MTRKPPSPPLPPYEERSHEELFKELAYLRAENAERGSQTISAVTLRRVLNVLGFLSRQGKLIHHTTTDSDTTETVIAAFVCGG